MSIYYLKNNEIDLNAWNNCINGSFNSSIYACSWYLDLVCETWDALVEDHYLSVMPLITRRYFGKSMIYIPELVNELGIFSNTPINAEKTHRFIEAIPQQFIYCHLLLNKYNPIDTQYIAHNIRQRFELDLIKPYHKQAGNFVPALRRKINMAMAMRYSFIKGLTPNDLIHFIVENNISIAKNISKNNFKLLRTIIAAIIRYKAGELYGVYNQYNSLESVALFGMFNNHINLLFQVAGSGKQENMPGIFLIDRFINKYSETNMILLFDTPSKSLYPLQYTDFGASESHSPVITINRAPLFAKLFSRLCNF
jgi:hypothetical protein